jgi:ACT domain-containing protein
MNTPKKHTSFGINYKLCNSKRYRSMYNMTVFGQIVDNLLTETINCLETVRPNR